jgi:hypothetical protein
MMRTYHGSCHCGAVRFTVELDLAQGTSKCNCSVCTKARFWKAFVPAEALRLLEGARDLADYQFGSRTIHHRFCRHCGTKPFGSGHTEALGDFHAVNVACLDNVSDADLAAIPVAFQDGRHDRWDRMPDETRYL